MKRITTLILALMLTLPMMGMSGFGGQDPEANQPSPFSAQLTDSSGQQISIKQATIDGKTSLRGFLGKGKVRIPFSNIDSIKIEADQATVRLSNAEESVTIRISGISRLQGSTAFGSYQIALKEVSEVSFSRIEQ